jgi:hypothetical protein
MNRETKAQENARAYQRRRLRELNAAAGIVTCEAKVREDTRSIHKAYKKRVTVREGPSWAVAAERVEYRTGMLDLQPREWVETKEDLEEVRRILRS